METKQVIVLRKDLNMRKGKMVAQGAHASLIAFRDATSIDGSQKQIGMEWLCGLMTKVCVSVNSEEELNDVYQRALDSGIPCSIITDAGKTEFGGVPTKTAVAIGPDEVEKINLITGGLPLL